VTANGEKVASLGRLIIEIELGDDTTIPVEVQIIELKDSKDRNLIIENDVIEKKKGNVDYNNRILTLQHKGKDVEMPFDFEHKEERNKAEDDEEYDAEVLKDFLGKEELEEEIEEQEVEAKLGILAQQTSGERLGKIYGEIEIRKD
jgi:hypothetical protein